MCFIIWATLRRFRFLDKDPLVRQDECLSSAYQLTHVAGDGRTDRQWNETPAPMEIQA